MQRWEPTNKAAAQAMRRKKSRYLTTEYRSLRKKAETVFEDPKVAEVKNFIDDWKWLWIAIAIIIAAFLKYPI